jgi:hypothetical protein
MTILRKRWLAAMTLGCAAIAVASWFAGRVVPDCGVPLAAPMLEFELALDHLGLARAIDCLPRRVELDRQNLVDLWLFIPAYCGFLAAFAWAAGVGRTATVLLGAAIALSDYAETLALRAMSASWPQTEISLLPVLAIGARTEVRADRRHAVGGSGLTMASQRGTGTAARSSNGCRVPWQYPVDDPRRRPRGLDHDRVSLAVYARLLVRTIPFEARGMTNEVNGRRAYNERCAGSPFRDARCIARHPGDPNGRYRSCVTVGWYAPRPLLRGRAIPA